MVIFGHKYSIFNGFGCIVFIFVNPVLIGEMATMKKMPIAIKVHAIITCRLTEVKSRLSDELKCLVE